MNWLGEPEEKFTLSLYTSEDVALEKVDTDPDYMRKYFAGLSDAPKAQKHMCGDVAVYEGTLSYYYYYSLVNETEEEQTVKIQFGYTKNINFFICIIH